MPTIHHLAQVVRALRIHVSHTCFQSLKQLLFGILVHQDIIRTDTDLPRIDKQCAGKDSACGNLKLGC
eukprot:Skav231055  [mRNA]  locus=scaffold2842:88578:88781:- [translate_table: standard]